MRDALFPGGADEDADFDLTTDARPDEIERLVRGWADDVWTQGARFGTIGCRRGARIYEITTHRAEVYVPDSRKPEVSFGDDIEVDLSRRDFTINALALRLPDMELIDPFDGLGDLAAGRLRTPLDPEISFADDPLRMLRGGTLRGPLLARARPGPGRRGPSGCTGASPSCRPSASATSSTRCVMVDVPSEALWFVVRTGLAGEFLPELPALALEQDPIHRHKDVLGPHARRGGQDLEGPDCSASPRSSTTSGKPRTRAITDGGVSFHHHEVVGARMTRVRMEAMRYPAAEIDTVVRLVELHLRFHTYRLGWTDKAVRRYVRDAGPHLDMLNELTRCDCTTRNASQGPVAGPPHGRARGADRRAPRAGGARRPAPGSRREPGHGAARPQPGPAVGEALRSSWSCASTRARSARRKRPTLRPAGRAVGALDAAPGLMAFRVDAEITGSRAPVQLGLVEDQWHPIEAGGAGRRDGAGMGKLVGGGGLRRTSQLAVRDRRGAARGVGLDEPEQQVLAVITTVPVVDRDLARQPAEGRLPWRSVSPWAHGVIASTEEMVTNVPRCHPWRNADLAPKAL